MVGPLPAGRSWSRGEEAELLDMLKSGSKVHTIARKLDRSVGAVYARISALKKRTARTGSMPSERLSAFRGHASGDKSKSQFR
jgi:hypothetical protein